MNDCTTMEDTAVAVMLKRLLKQRLESYGSSISYDEIKTLCCMLGIEREDKR